MSHAVGRLNASFSTQPLYRCYTRRRLLSLSSLQTKSLSTLKKAIKRKLKSQKSLLHHHGRGRRQQTPPTGLQNPAGPAKSQRGAVLRTAVAVCQQNPAAPAKSQLRAVLRTAVAVCQRGANVYPLPRPCHPPRPLAKPTRASHSRSFKISDRPQLPKTD
jgi:hypothetical protein